MKDFRMVKIALAFVLALAVCVPACLAEGSGKEAIFFETVAQTDGAVKGKPIVVDIDIADFKQPNVVQGEPIIVDIDITDYLS